MARHQTHRRAKLSSTRQRRHVHTAFQTIPELRQSFDYIDQFVAHRIQSGVPKEQLVKEVQREWLRVFSKRMEKKSATAFVEHQLERSARKRKGSRTHRRHRGGVAPAADSTTQPGIYLASGLPPTSNGSYPMANGSPSVYGSLTAYLNKGLMAPPEQSILSDPVKGQSVFPSAATSPLLTTSPLLKGGGRGRLPRARRQQGVSGGAIPLVGAALEQMTTKPIPAGIPPSNVLRDTQTMWYGQTSGPSPDQVGRGPTYQLGDSMFPKMVNVRIDV